MLSKIKLNEIDISQNQCLKKVRIHAWHSSLVGIPKGIDKIKLEKFEAFHLNLTEKEKAIVKKYIKSW